MTTPTYNTATASFINGITPSTPIEMISAALDKQPRQMISCAPWPGYHQKPYCAFAIAHSHNCILLKYYVTETNVLARFTEPNSLVYKDSCVEFFISFDSNDQYYNLEFNCLGTCYMAYGNHLNERQKAQPALLSNIKSHTMLNRNEGKITWELTLMIPNDVFFAHQLKNLTSLNTRANFYKCGDDLPSPHYLTWSPIDSPAPNFHLPVFFGHIKFDEGNGVEQA